MNRRKVTSTGLVLTSVFVITIHHSRADAPVRFHCQGMAGGHQNDGLSFDGPLNNDLVYDAARESISREQNGELVGSWHVTVDGGVLRWTSNEITKEFFDIDGLTY